jgi:hypothetical protein
VFVMCVATSMTPHMKKKHTHTNTTHTPLFLIFPLFLDFFSFTIFLLDLLDLLYLLNFRFSSCVSLSFAPFSRRKTRKALSLLGQSYLLLNQT